MAYTEKGSGLFLIYDLPVKYVKNGHGYQPKGPQYLINKLAEGGMVERMQFSVLLIKEPRALDMLIPALEAHDASYMLISGEYEAVYNLRREKVK